MNRTVIAGYVRTPFAFARKGPFHATRPDDLAAVALAELVRRSGIDPHLIEDVLMGCAYPEGAQGDNVARIASLLAGLPVQIGAATVNRFCGSSMYAIHMAAGQIALGAGEAFIAAGVESMTMVPQGGLSASPNPRFASREHPDADIPTQAYTPMGITAENVAARWAIPREQQDAFAVESQRKASRAQAEGRLDDELVPVITPDGTVVDRDLCLRPQTSLEGLAALKPAFGEGGTVTAGTASPLTDGAVAVLVTSEAFARQHGLDMLARVRSTAIAGLEPEIMGMGPVHATRKALARAGLRIEDMDVIEINEAFASQAIACMRELVIHPDRTNIDGGAIALGHPLGATGARITAKAATLLRRVNGRYALATQCIGGGQGIATVLEAL
ncbi:thiolase family protein [Burkholderia cepacia]|uniref:thiolase family protein n=1 Tax=Burkholderia cepacia TaxID=292 RepID=UPI001CF355EB|nr:thiolase family protein [Burkholderia cepacia]MCA8114682.1 thiolase family protein [Burkholderia cepacia]MCA8401783.1 thiolase family protein [Burkholderia cepacia]